MVRTTEKKRLTFDDLVAGISSALVLRDIDLLENSDERLAHAFKKAADFLQEKAERYGLQIRFRIYPHQIHGDSETVNRGILQAAQDGLLVFPQPGRSLRFTMDKQMAQAVLSGLPGGPDLYKDASSVFFDSYSLYARR